MAIFIFLCNLVITLKFWGHDWIKVKTSVCLDKLNKNIVCLKISAVLERKQESS